MTSLPDADPEHAAPVAEGARVRPIVHEMPGPDVIAYAMESGRRLGQATDSLNEVLEQVEDFFERLALGVSASVPLGTAFSYCRLWFKKEGEWGLFVEQQDGSFVPLLNCSRLQRCEATVLFGALLASLIVEADAQSLSARHAKGIAELFLQRVNL